MMLILIARFILAAWFLGMVVIISALSNNRRHTIPVEEAQKMLASGYYKSVNHYKNL